MKNIRLITGFHLTANDRKVINEMESAGLCHATKGRTAFSLSRHELREKPGSFVWHFQRRYRQTVTIGKGIEDITDNFTFTATEQPKQTTLI
jgi:hypothetical protein